MDGVYFIGTISTAVTMTGTILAQLIVEGTTKRVVQFTAHLDLAAGHAILYRVRVPGQCTARAAPHYHEASHGFCMLAQRWKNTSITTKASRHEHLNVTLFDETEMEHEEPAARTASVHQCHALFFRHGAGPKVRLHRADDVMMR